MITKKLAVPLVNEKILAQAQQCYIATSQITDAGFDFIRTRVPSNCKINLVTSLDGATSPNVLQRIWRHYQGRITLNIYTRNVLHANVYVFDLPYRKSVAFVGSGSVSLEGIKDQEELFWKITDAKEIESLMSWYTSYFEFGNPLTESLIREYEKIYPTVRQRQIDSQKEKELAIRLSYLSLEGIKFKNQYFKKEDFTSLGTAESPDRETLQNKLNQLVISLQSENHKLPNNTTTTLKNNSADVTFPHEEGYSHSIISLSPIDITLSLVFEGGPNHFKQRQQLSFSLAQETFVQSLFQALKSFSPDYSIEVAGVSRTITSITNEKMLAEFIQNDFGFHFQIIIAKTFTPDDAALASEKITNTLNTEFINMEPVIKLMKGIHVA